MEDLTTLSKIYCGWLLGENVLLIEPRQDQVLCVQNYQTALPHVHPAYHILGMSSVAHS